MSGADEDRRATLTPPAPPATPLGTRAERDYRRGYHHAAVEALRALRAGSTVADLDRWLDALEAWRERPDGDAFVPPPAPWGRP